MVRLVNVPRQRVYGGVPLELPLIRMSDAEAVEIPGPQIYDQDYPLNYDGLQLNPSWGASPYYVNSVHPGNIALTPSEQRMAGLGGFGDLAALGLTAAQIDAKNKAAAAKAEALRLSKEAAATAKANAAASALALKIAKQQADITAKANAAAAKLAAQTQATQAKADAAKTKADAATAARIQKEADQRLKADTATANKAADAHNKLIAQCAKAGGAWDDTTGTCGGFASVAAFTASAKAEAAKIKTDAAAQKKTDAAAAKLLTAQQKADEKKIKDDAALLAKQNKTEAAQVDKMIKACQKQGGFWDFVNKICNPGAGQAGQCQPGYAPSTAPGSNGQCIPIGLGPTPGSCPYGADAYGTCLPGGGGIIDPIVGPTGPVGPIQPQCPPGTYPDQYGQCAPIGGQPPPWTQQPPPWMTQQPPWTQQPPPPLTQPGGSISPDPFSGGGGGGGGSPMIQSGQGPGPQMNEQATDVSQAPQSDNTTAEEAASTQDGSGQDEQTEGTDDASNVAQGGILDSISKFFSGMNGLSCGLDQPPSWFAGSLNGNVPVFRPVVKKVPAPVKRSTTSGVLLTAGILVLGSAALYMWSKGKKKRSKRSSRR